MGGNQNEYWISKRKTKQKLQQNESGGYWA